MTTKNSTINNFHSNKLTFEELQEIKDILENDTEFSSQEVDKILFLRDLFEKNGIKVNDLDTFLNILNGLKLGKLI